MSQAPSVDPPFDLVKFVVALSGALETANEEMADHQARTAAIALALAQRLGFSPERIRDLFFAAILHDVGAMSPEEKIELHCGNAHFIERHTRVGETLMGSLPHFERAARIVALHHSDWTRSRDLVAEDLALEGNIVALADAVERSIKRHSYILHQEEGIRASILRERGGAFSAEVTDAFMDLSAREVFWLDIESSHSPAELESLLPFGKFLVPREDLLQVSVFVRNLIDFRSSFTATHSSGVSAAARELGRSMGIRGGALRDLEVAGNLHDIGKMSVGDEILLKPGPLDSRETAVIRKHSYHTYRFIRASGAGLKIAAWAGFHHERLDGTGYPFHHRASSLDLGARILSVADTITALAEDRPYREGLKRSTSLSIVSAMAERGSLDSDVVAALVTSFDEVLGMAKVAQASAVQDYETRVQT
jgi:putative nucleotidyltransferase with HDIG domain